MRFSIYVQRDDPDFAIFDRELGSPPVGVSADYDCTGVFRCVELGVLLLWNQNGFPHCAISVADEWMLGAKSILNGDFTDHRTGNTAKIKKLWPVLVEQ